MNRNQHGNGHEVLGKSDTDFPSDTFHLMPIKEVSGKTRKKGHTTYNLLGKAHDRKTTFLHLLLNGQSIPSSSIPHQATKYAIDRLVGERNYEYTSVPSHLHSIFRSLRSGRLGNHLSNRANDSNMKELMLVIQGLLLLNHYNNFM
eukprot:Gb_05486 [translate_table: standard]